MFRAWLSDLGADYQGACRRLSTLNVLSHDHGIGWGACLPEMDTYGSIQCNFGNHRTRRRSMSASRSHLSLNTRNNNFKSSMTEAYCRLVVFQPSGSDLPASRVAYASCCTLSMSIVVVDVTDP